MKHVTAWVVVFLVMGLGLFGWVNLQQSQPLVRPVLKTNGWNIAENLWFPKEVVASDSGEVVEVGAKAAFFVETNSGRVLYSKDEHQRLPVASLTKIMTAIVTLEHKNWDDRMLVSQAAADMEPDRMELKAGETLTVEELMDGMFLVSANDAAEVLAESVFLNRDEFIKRMNSRARELGMNNTWFVNPTGLEEDDHQQFSSAYDVALMARFAIAHFPHLIDITSQPHIYLPQSPTHQDYDLYSGINLLTTYPGVIGFKTGYTPEAGMTLVSVARRGNTQVLGVLLGDEDRRGDARKLLDYSFERLQR